MKITSRQKKDIETILEFIPYSHKDVVITEQDILDFLNYSSHGIYPENRKGKGKFDGGIDGFSALVQGKRMRGLHMELWEDGNLEGTMPYYTLLQNENGPISPALKDFMKKEMFKGVDAEMIENLYQDIIAEYDNV
jgi:hypothetical protein